MAVQMQVAHSSLFKGAGIISGGPYYCAGTNSPAICMGVLTPKIYQSIASTNYWSGNYIDDKQNLAHHKVYMYSSTKDLIIGNAITNQLYKYYVTEGGFIPPNNVMFKNDLQGGHTFPTDFNSTGNNVCAASVSPFISNCKFDGAGAILNYIYEDLNPRNGGQLSGQFIQYNQGDFMDYPAYYGMDKNGWAYIPLNCSQKQLCKLHIVLHGCYQGYYFIRDKFVKNTGYTRWADSNNIILVFPQAKPSGLKWGSKLLPNLMGCWDFMGFYGADYTVKSGKQISAIKTMIDYIVKGNN